MEEMEEMNDYMGVQEREGQVVVRVSYVDDEDGEYSVFFWISDRDYSKIEEYNIHPWAHHIGVMINFYMPEFYDKVDKAVVSTGIFITEVRLYDPQEDGDIVGERGDMVFCYDESDCYYMTSGDEMECSPDAYLPF